MNFITSLLFIAIIFIFLLKKYYNGLLILILLSLLGNMLYFNFFGSRIIIFQLIALLIFPVIVMQKKAKIYSIINGIKYEYIVLIFLAIIFGFLFPWEHASETRSWNQLASGRSLLH